MSDKYLISKDDLVKILMKFEDFSISEATVNLLLRKLKPFLREEKKSFDEVVNKVCKELPEGFAINLYMENGSGYIELFLHNCCINDDFSHIETIEGQIIEALEIAKNYGKW